MTKTNTTGPVKPVHKKKMRPLKKAPQAPKRFKSSYILFFIQVQEKIKKSLPVGQASAPEVSKRASEMWKALSAEDRLHWDNEAAKEKQRYLAEKEVYTGPWQVPHRRAKKDPTAPKRNPSAFLLFSLTKRKELKGKNPQLKNTDISRILGQLWRSTSDEEKRPFVEREQIEREKYKEKMAAWREMKAQENEAKKKEDAAKADRALVEKSLKEQELTEKTYGIIDTAEENLTLKAATQTQQQPQRHDSYTAQSYRQTSPLPHPNAFVDHYQYGQQQGSWPNPEIHSHNSNMVSSHGNHHPMNVQYRSPHSNHNQPMNSFDTFPNQQQLGFSDHSPFYDSNQQRPLKLEGGADSPYSYTEEFDPVPIH